MKVEIGNKATSKSWQKEFPEDTKCCKCGGISRIAFVAHEGFDVDDKPVFPRNFEQYVCDLNKETTGYWPHDCIAVAVYLCRDCLAPTAIFNQG